MCLGTKAVLFIEPAGSMIFLGAAKFEMGGIDRFRESYQGRADAGELPFGSNEKLVDEVREKAKHPDRSAIDLRHPEFAALFQCLNEARAGYCDWMGVAKKGIGCVDGAVRGRRDEIQIARLIWSNLKQMTAMHGARK